MDTLRVTARQPPLDASIVATNLWVGAKPPPGTYPWSVLVLCAKEYQPLASLFPGVHVIHAPFDDSGRAMTTAEAAIAIQAAKAVATLLKLRRPVLVTCAMGLNRSGLVAALALLYARKLDAETAVARVRAARGAGALANQDFVKLIAHVARR